jgi:glycosyltransferase involved in cell wall biosynthesis
LRPRIAVATARYGDTWDELSLLANRIAGALACTGEVDVLVPGSRAVAPEVGWDGACRVLRFPAETIDSRRRAAWRLVARAADADAPVACRCQTGVAMPLPPLVEEQLVLAEGGDAPELYDHIGSTTYDFTVFVGLHSPVTCYGLRAVPANRRTLLVPGSYEAAVLRIHDECLDRVDRVMVCTEMERGRMVGRIGSGLADRVQNVRALIGVNTIVREPLAPRRDRFVVVARDWRTPGSLRRYGPWAKALARTLPEGVGLRLVGPGAATLPGGVAHTDTRIDSWWWMSRALAVIDPAPHRVVGQEVLESLMFGVPVVVAAHGDATREHAEIGGGGLWYRVDDELAGCVELLLDEDVRRSLGDHGRSYALSRFGDTDTYVKRISQALFG